MLRWQRRILEDNTHYIAQNLDLREVIPYLQSRRILKDYHVEELNSERPFTSRQTLIRLLKQRGPDAYVAFLESLYISDQHDLLRRLVPPWFTVKIEPQPEPQANSELTPISNEELLAIMPDENFRIGLCDDLPIVRQPDMELVIANQQFYAQELRAYADRAFLEPKGVLDNLDVNFCDSPLMSWNEADNYRNFSKPKGLVLIINNEKFARMPSRLGTNVDCVNISRLFERLGYQVHVKKDLTADEMISKTQKFAEKKEHRRCDSAVVVVMTHGQNGALHGSDDRLVQVDELVAQLNAFNCPALKGKPKLFLIQACRGDRYDSGHAVHTDSVDGPVKNGKKTQDDDSLTLSEQLEKLDMTDAAGITEKITKLPTDADILVAYATTPGYVSWRNSAKGSWFIQSICEVFAQYAKDEHVMDMMTRVNRRVAEAFVSSSGHKQIPDPCCRLLKKFFFYPGLYNSTS